MLKELYTAAMGMLPQQTRLEVLSNNMANANTTGFKREAVFERNLIEAQNNFFNVPGDAEQEDPPTGSYIDFRMGAFMQTDNPLDVAIEKENGFFMLQDKDGNEFYSKAGHFKLSEDGTFITMDGKMLMGSNGPLNVQSEFIVDPLNTADSNAISIKISEDGEVFANEALIGSIQIAEIENLESLQKVSSASFIATVDTILNYLPQDEAVLRQGWLENSNVNIISEMIAMIELQRMFEAGSKVIQTNDSTLDDSIQIGRYY